MKEELVTFPTAKLAKEKKFDWETQAMTCGENYPIINNPESETPYNWNERKGYSIPTQSLLQKWLREKHGILIHLFPNKSGNWWVNLTNETITCKTTYELALEEGLQEALKSIP